VTLLLLAPSSSTPGPEIFRFLAQPPPSLRGDIILGDGAANTGRFDQRQGLLVMSNTSSANGSWYFVGRSGGTGIYNLADTSVSGTGISTYGIGSGSAVVGKLHIGGAYFFPGGTGTVNINTTGTFTANSTESTSYIFGNSAFASINIGVGDFGANLGTGTLNLENGTVNSTGQIWIGSFGGTGTLNQTGGTINTSGLVFGKWVGSGTMGITSGTVNAGFVSLGAAGATTDRVQGTLNVNGGGILNSEGDFILAQGGSGANGSFGNLNIATGGTVNVATTVERWFIVNQFDTISGTLNINGGTLNLNANGDLRFSTNGNTGASVVNLNSGAITGWNGNQTGASLSSVVDLNTAGGAGVNNTFNLNGGTLMVNQIISTSATGTRVFNFNGGTLKAAGASTAFMDANAASATNILAGGAVIDTNGFDITIGQALLSGTAGDGGLTKTGTGTLTLSGSNSYNGNSLVNSGTLAFTTSQSNIGGLSMANGSGLRIASLGAANQTVLTTTSLTLGNTTMSFDFNSFDSTVPLISTGAVTLNGTTGFNLSNGAFLTTGTHQLISYSSFGGSGTLLTGGTFTFTPRNTGTIVNANNAVSVVIIANSPEWNGNINGNWDIDTTGTGGQGTKNWRSSGNPTTYFQTATGTDSVIFSDNATGTTTVNVVAAVSLLGVLFNNNTKTYTLTGTGGIAGSSGLVKSGTGTLVITNTNTYSGVTTINAGALQIGDGITDGNIASTPSILNNGTFVYNRSAGSSFTYGGIVSGSSSLVKSGSGTQILTATNTYSGGTTINSGTLRLTTTAGAANTGVFNLSGGAFQVDLGTGNNFGYAPTLNLTGSNATFGNAAASSLANVNGQINFTGVINGNNNPLNILNTGTARLYVNSPSINNVSIIDVLAGAMGLDLNVATPGGGAPVNVSNGAALWFAGNGNTIANDLTFNGGDGLGGGALFYEGGVPVPTALSSNVTLASGTTGIGSGFGDTITLNGTVGGSGALKVINGTLTLTNANTYSGGTILNAGTLAVGNNSALGIGSLTLAGGTFQNSGGFGSVRTLTNSILAQSGTSAAITAIANTGFNLNGNVSGAGNLNLAATFNSSGLLLGGTNSSYSGTATVSGQNVRIASTAASANAAWVVNGALQLESAGSNTYDLGSLSGTGNINGHAINASPGPVSTIVEGALNASTTFSGTIINQAVNDAVTGNNDAAANNVLALTKVGTGTLTLSGSSAYTGGTTVSGGILSVAPGGNVGKGNVSVMSTAVQLTIQTGVVDAISDNATLSLAGGGTGNTADVGCAFLDAGINETVGGLILGGAVQTTPGTYGSLASSATFKSDEYWSGSGLVTLAAVPEPSTWIMMLSGIGMLGFYRRLRRNNRSL
jgi:fibronectin-binding autotransporter adhesin